MVEHDGGEEVALTATDPGSGYQRNGLEISATLATRDHGGQLVNDKVNDVLGNVHYAECRIVGVHLRDMKRACCGDRRSLSQRSSTSIIAHVFTQLFGPAKTQPGTG